MTRTIKMEISRSFNNKFFVISLIIGIGIVVFYAIDSLPFCIAENEQFATGETFPMDYYKVSYIHWIGSMVVSVAQYIFYLIIPLLAVLPFAGSLFSDIKSGYVKNICVRTNKKHYLIGKYIGVFLSGGAAVAIPLAVSFLITTAFLPTMTPEAAYYLTNVYFTQKWAEVIFQSPIMYVFLYIMLAFLYAGLLATFSLFISFITDKSFLPLVIPFFIYITISFSCEIFEIQDYNIMSFLKPIVTTGSTFSVLIWALGMFLVSFIPYYAIGVKKDVY